MTYYISCMTGIYSSHKEAVDAAVVLALERHPWLNIHVIDLERVIIRESMMVCEKGMGTRITVIYKDISGKYLGYADYLDVELPL